MTLQEYLNQIAFEDEGVFLYTSQSNYDTHRPLILLGLTLTLGPVKELGSGNSSTPLLLNYCHINKRKFKSFDNNKEWAAKTGSEYVEDWDTNTDWQYPCGLLFIDHAPGEHRWKAIQTMADKADIIVFHDSELGGAGNYQYDKIYPLFKYQLHYNRRGGGAGCSMVSNKIDVSVYRGLKLGQFQFDQ